MLNADPVGRWITRLTGRTLDQHAADPIPAAAHLPQAASDLRHTRTELLLTVDRLRTALINEDDLTATVAAVTGPLAAIEQLGRDYQYARKRADLFIGDQDRAQYADANTGRTLRRRYVNPGDKVLVVLPHTDSCRKQHLAGRHTHIRVGASDAELDPTVGPAQLRLPHADAGIYHDPDHGTLYVLEPTADAPAASSD